MGLGTFTKKTYLSIHHGIVEKTGGDGQKQHFGYVEGHLTAIYKKEREYNGEKVLKWFLEITDESGEVFCTSFPYNSGTFKSIVLALGSDEGLSSTSTVRIEPYEKGNFTNVVVWSDGVKCEWMTRDLPPVEKVTIGGRQYNDETKRMEFIENVVEMLLKRLSRQ